MKNLKLNRPLAFIDLETTGLKPYSDRIVELSILKIHTDGREEYHSRRINPGVPIPPEATAVHGISDDDVANEPKFARYAKSIHDFLEGCDIAGFNVIAFDLPCLESELARVGVEFSRQGRHLIDSKIIYHQREPRDLQAAYQKYCGKEMKNAHVAKEDAKASAEILEGQLEMYEDLPRDIAGLGVLCYKIGENYIDAEGKFIWSEGEALCNFGKKHQGRKLKDIATEDPSYLSWIASADFSVEVRKIAINALSGEFPQPPEPPQPTKEET